MRIRIGDPASATDLSEFLRVRIGAVVEEKGAERPGSDSELEVSLLGSYSEEAHRTEIEAAVRRWAMYRQRPEPVVEP